MNYHLFSFLLQLAPSVNLSVDTFPEKRGRLFYVNHLVIFVFIRIKIWFLSSLVSASPEHGGKCRAKRGDRGEVCVHRLKSFCNVLLTLISTLSFLLQLALSDKQGRLMFRVLYVSFKKLCLFKINSLLPSFLSGGSMRMSRTEPQRDEW